MDSKAILTDAGIKPSFHRLKIMEYLIEKKNHPTVDMIFQEISENIPTLSKTTIYNTLKTFNEFNLVQLITIEDNEVRYDADMSSHGHFKCTSCNNVYDIFFKDPAYEIKEIEGHTIEEAQIYFKGMCKHCN